MRGMDPNIIIAEIEEYARRTGLKPSSVCQLATGNARLYDRLKRRVEKDRSSVAALRNWIAERSPTTGDAA